VENYKVINNITAEGLQDALNAVDPAWQVFQVLQMLTFDHVTIMGAKISLPKEFLFTIVLERRSE
jgi:hypothetical protein